MNMVRAGLLIIRTAVLALGVSAPAGAIKDELGFVRIRPAEVQWREEAGYDGLKIAVLEGDPSKSGLYVIRVRFPPGLMTRPHRHPEDRHAIVISGTWYTGTGSTFDRAKTVPLAPGSYMKHPANAYHFDGAGQDEVIVQIVGIGPSDTIFARPDDGPTIRPGSTH
jgi:quercetin dioxygenase-like cupin family protein